MKHSKIGLLVLLYLALISACSSTMEESSTTTPVINSTNTIVVPTSTETSTPTLVPTATFAVEENRPTPIYTETVSKNLWGVNITVNLITDNSFSPAIKKVTMNEEKLVEFVARTMFRVWWANGNTKHTGTPTEKDLQSFITLWAQAQNSGSPADWEKVEFTIYANDLNDSSGVVEKPYKIWLMYEGETPDGVRGISEISFVLLNSKKFIHISFINEEVGFGYETVLDDDVFLVYCADRKSVV